jgi:small subunit ribosomal protein S17e
MGRIKTKLIKRVTQDLMEAHGDQGKEDFVDNKKLVDKYVDTSSKKIRNSIAGYVTRQVKNKAE